jgi:hypothetical protein
MNTSIAVMTSVPPEASGVAGALLQVSLQLGAVLALSIQSGFLTRKPGSFRNYENVQASFWWQVGWCIFNLIIFLAFFKGGRDKQVGEANEARAEEEGSRKQEDEARHT